MCVLSVCLSVCVFVMCIPDAYRGQKREVDPPGTGVTDGCELLCGVETWTQVLCKNKNKK